LMEFTFAASPWEGMEAGQTLSAAQALTVLAPLDDTDAQDALDELEQLGITLDASTLPMYSGTGETATRLSLERKLAAQGDLMGSLEETDPLRLYLEELAHTPAAGDVNILAMEYARGDEAAAQRLTDLMLGTVVEEARGYTGRGVLLLDLIQEGSMGLWQSILQYTQGEFQPHALWWIRQYLAKAVTLQARADGVGRKLVEAMEDYRSVCDRLSGELGRNPDRQEIAQAMHITPEELEAVTDILETARTMEYLKPRQPEPEDPEETQAVEDTAYFQMRQRIAELMSSLTEQEAKLLTLRYGLEGGLPMRPAEAGAKLGLTAREAEAMEAAALSKLRKQ